MSQGAVAQQQLTSGDLTAARKSIAEAIDERDDLAELHLLRGRIEIAGKRYAAAFDAYSAALALEATNPEALLGVAQLGLRTGHLDEAEEAAGRILTLEPNQPEALLIKGLLALVRNRPAEAIEDADKILAGSPSNEGGVILKARALYLRGDPGQALKLIDQAVPLVGNTAGLIQTKLELFREAGDQAGMLGQFEKLRLLRPDDFDLTIDEANLRYKTGDKLGGRRLLRDALLSPNRRASEAVRIASLWREYDTEPLDASERMRLRSISSAVRGEVARYYLDSGRAEPAAQLLAGDPSLAARALAARVAIALGDLPSGTEGAEKILEADRTQCDALIARSAGLLARGQNAPAVVAAQTAAAECPQNTAAWLQLARANEARGKPSEAGRAFADAVSRNPQNAQLSAEYIDWLERHGATRQAMGEARRLTRKTPAQVSAWTAYVAACERQLQSGCTSVARAGRTQALRKLGIDLPIDERAPNGLFGRLPPR
ncbi:tetratricopeptide repeat protein [Novosphingobium sp. Gsoil 351]|uniref:tetratricopeptide repeat protein n=1 Tax=Novosphingobium sp. Gsoil 351 TaxID=2675225 RepID=UPI0012B45192|nr:tetratricopeptide repeat protein [Novosphingobium sp. Gsoil 351]QGN56090.1 tetratricopeptide repeat protein [Novosphingobium sp. Gsoil 351]